MYPAVTIASITPIAEEIGHGTVERLSAVDVLQVEDGPLDAVGLRTLGRLDPGTIRQDEGRSGPQTG